MIGLVQLFRSRRNNRFGARFHSNLTANADKKRKRIILKKGNAFICFAVPIFVHIIVLFKFIPAPLVLNSMQHRCG